MKYFSKTLLIILILSGILACTETGDKTNKKGKEQTLKVVKKNRDNGTLSSATQVDSEGYAHGIKVSYYEDGRSIHSKVTFNHGMKHGAAVWYYRNGKVFEHTNFADGRRSGVTKKYHKNGQLLSQCEFEKGDALPGLVEYTENGTKITEYPQVKFKKIDKIAFENRVILEISSTVKSSKVKYYHLLQLDNGMTSKSFLQSKAGVANMIFSVNPGKVVMRNIEIYAELPTQLGNTLVTTVSYQLAAKNRR